MAVDSREPYMSLHELRIAEGNRISDTYKRVVQREFGTAFTAGPDHSKWKPYHVLVQATETNYLKRNFTLARQENPEDIRQDDIACMTIAATLFYPDYNDMYNYDPSFAKSAMKQSGLFSNRDYEIAEIVARASVAKKSKDSAVEFKQIDTTSKYALQKQVFVDTVWTTQTRPDGIFLYAMLGVERLIEAGAIETRDGSLPHTIDEVIAPDTIFDPKVLEKHFLFVSEITFGENVYRPRFSSDNYFEQNKEYFSQEMRALKDDSSRANLGDVIRKAAAFSHVQLPGLS